MKICCQFFAAAVAVCTPLCVSGQDHPVTFRVGVILPLSGANAFGDGMLKGCQMGVEDSAERFPSSRPIQAVFEDDQYNPAKTISALRKLIDVDKISAVISTSAGPTRAIIPVINSHGLPLLAIATNDGFTAESKFAFSLWVPPEVEAGAMADEVLRRGYRRLARISAVNPVFEELNRHFDKMLKGKVKLLLDQGFDPNETDFRSILNRIKALQELDAIVVNLLPAGAGRFAKQARELEIRQDLFAAETFESPEAIQLSGGALEGQWYVTYASPQDAFHDKFRKRYPDTIMIGAANCYDAIQLIAAALQNGADRDSLVKYLSSVRDFKGALGTLSVRQDRSFHMPAAIRVVRGQGYEQLRVFGE